MIPKKPVPELIRDGNRFSDKIMLKEIQAACARRSLRRSGPW